MLNNDRPYPSCVFKTKFIRKGKQLYSLKKIFLITKEPSDIINSVFYFYFLTKLIEFHDITSFREVKPDDTLIDSIQSLISTIKRQCFTEKMTEFKITIYTGKYRLIDSNSLLLSYKGNILFAKANQINDLDSNKFIMSPTIKYVFSNTDLLQLNNKNQLGASNDKLIKNTLLKFRLDLTKTSFKNSLSQMRCTKKYYPIREKKAFFPHINSESFRYHKYNFSFLDLIESGKELSGTIKTPPPVELPSHYLSLKKLHSNKTIRDKCKYFFNATLYPIDQESQARVSMTHSKSCQAMTSNRQLQNIHKYFGFKRNSSLLKFTNSKTIVQYPPIDNIKQEYTTLIGEFRDYIIVHLDNTIKQSSVSLFNLPYSFLFNQHYPKFPFTQCQKEFIFYSYISYQFDSHHPGLLQLFKQQNDSKPSQVISHIIEYRSILHDLIDHPIKIIHYAIGKTEIKLSSAFFQIFILCFDYFDKTQSLLSDIVMMVQRISTTSHISFAQFSHYYLYFKRCWLLTKEKQYLFLKKIITFITNQHNNQKEISNYDNEDVSKEEQVDKYDDHKEKSIMNITAKEVNYDILDRFRSVFQLSESLLKLLLTQYDCLSPMKIKRKQAKLDVLFKKVINYFNKQ